MKECRYIGGGDYEISWSFRMNNPNRYARTSISIERSKIVDEAAARRFCRKWDLEFVAEGKAIAQ